MASSDLKCSRTNYSNLTHTFPEDEKREYFPVQFHAARPQVQKVKEKSRKSIYRSISLMNIDAKILDMIIINGIFSI